MADFRWTIVEAANAGIAPEMFWPMMFWIGVYVVVYSVVAYIILRRLGVIGRRGIDNYSYETRRP